MVMIDSKAYIVAMLHSIALEACIVAALVLVDDAGF